VTDTATAARRAPARWPPALRGLADQPTGRRTGRKSPRDQTFGHATGRGVSADPSGSALLRGAAPVGSAESPSPRRRGDCAKVAGRAKKDSHIPPVRRWDGLRPGANLRGVVHPPGASATGGRDSGQPEARRTSAPAGKETDPHKAKPKGASSSGSRQRGLTATDFTADQDLEADGPLQQSRARRTARETTSTGRPGRDHNGEKVRTAVARNLDRPRRPQETRSGSPDRTLGGRRDRRDRLTRHGCREGESSEGWSVTGTAQEARARFPVPDRRARVLRSPGAPRTAPGQQEFPPGNTGWTRPARAGAGQGARPSPESPKRGEPHGRFQGATNLESAGRSKPSKPGGTARAERTRRVASPGRRQSDAASRFLGTRRTAAPRSIAPARSGRLALMPMEGRTLTTPREVALDSRRAGSEVFGPQASKDEQGGADWTASSKERRRS